MQAYLKNSPKKTRKKFLALSRNIFTLKIDERKLRVCAPTPAKPTRKIDQIQQPLLIKYIIIPLGYKYR